MSAMGVASAMVLDAARTMKAVGQDRYGSPDVLTLRDVPVPVPADEAVLVRVRASSVNAVDWHAMRGEPFLVRLTDGLLRPKIAIRGVDAAGVVEAVGAKVAHLQPGDEVFGMRNGAWAEYLSGRTFVRKPTNLTFEEAAAVPVAGVTALQALRRKGGLAAGERVLVTGAGGGVGTFAVQVARALGAKVSAATSPRHLEMVGALGVDRVFDYTAGDFTRDGSRYDLIVDIGGGRSLGDLSRVMAPGGRLVVVGGGIGKGRWLGPVVRPALAALRSRLRGQRMLPFLSNASTDDLLVLAEMLERGTVRPIIDRTYPLAETAEAVRYVETGQAGGKVVITV
jgi:NADPH:quinone reductase-like Zn-dependent oxidoreductase